MASDENTAFCPFCGQNTLETMKYGTRCLKCNCLFEVVFFGLYKESRYHDVAALLKKMEQEQMVKMK
jgi:hypothetical protein